SATFYCRPQYWTGSAGRYAMPLPGSPTVRKIYYIWIDPIFLSIRWTISGNGIVITVSLPIYCEQGWRMSKRI
ncbi:MAG: hypothetical protein KDE62_17485, partial [Calditrichaeota bacterium]|nr:hypothetical protein [Calditrichota bacterium]